MLRIRETAPARKQTAISGLSAMRIGDLENKMALGKMSSVKS